VKSENMELCVAEFRRWEKPGLKRRSRELGQLVVAEVFVGIG
jgi:hypothetical protein